MDPLTDEYRTETKLRYFGYALAVGAAFYPVAPQIVQCLLKLIAALYLLMDVVASSRGVYACTGMFGVVLMKAVDVCIFHLFASLIVPCLVTHGIVNILGMCICVWNLVPSIAAIAVIPFISKSIDNYTMMVMDCTTRRCLSRIYCKFDTYDVSTVFTQAGC